MPEFGAPVPAADIFVHTAQVEVKLVDGGLFEQRRLRFDHLADDMRLLRIRFHIAAQDDCIGAQLKRLFHRHGRPDTESTRFIAAGCYHAPVAAAADEQGLALQAAVAQAFDGYEKGVEVEVKDGAVEQDIWIGG